MDTCELISSSFVMLQEKESWDMNTQEKIEAAGKKKEEGNTLFKAGKYARASKRYERVSTRTRASCDVCEKVKFGF